jgi:hypothetical protein
MDHAKGLIPVLMGGLGNQMFIVAAGYVAHKYSNASLYILQDPPENNPHNIKNRNYNDSIFKYFGKHLPLLHNNRLFSEYKHFHQRGTFNSWPPKKIEPGTYLHGNFQFYPPIEQFENEIRELFLRGLESFLENIPDYFNCAFLHIRRGDYLDNPGYHFIQPIEYYKSAIDDLIKKTRIEKILVFSDDIEWIKLQPFFSSELFHIYESDDELEILACMTKCTAGAICGNSTFSWWGAFLGAHAKRNPVYVPEKWVNRSVLYLFPKEWTILA